LLGRRIGWCCVCLSYWCTQYHGVSQSVSKLESFQEIVWILNFLKVFLSLYRCAFHPFLLLGCRPHQIVSDWDELINSVYWHLIRTTEGMV
jgi:hypothetical protein